MDPYIRINSNGNYRDGIKSEGDKIMTACTHSTVIEDARIPSPKESMPQALYCRRDTQLSLELMYIINTQCSCYVEVSVSEWNRYNCSYQVCSI